FTLFNHLGEKINSVEADEEGLSLTLTDAPVYIVPEKPNDVLRVGAAWQRAPLEVFGRAEDLNRVTLRVTNPLERRIRITSFSAGPSATQWLNPGASASAAMRVSLLRDPVPVAMKLDVRVN